MEELKKKVRDVILTYFELDDNGNPTIPTNEDVGQIEPMEFSATALDAIWKLVKD